MVKMLFTFAMILMAADSYADQYTVTRSSIIKGAQTDIRLTTASITVWRIEVSSGFSGSSFRINGGTITQNKTSTQTFDTGSTQNKQYLNQSFGGALLTTVGSSEIRLYWDYTGKPPKGEEGRGLERQ